MLPVPPVKARWQWAGTLAVAALMGLAILGSTLPDLSPTADKQGEHAGILSSTTLLERHALWNTTLRLVDRHPTLGVGAGNWKVCYPEASTRDLFSADVLDFTFVRPHNDYLRVLAETGCVGFVLLLLSLASPIARALGRTRRTLRAERVTGTALAYTAALLVAAWIDFPFDRTETLVWSSITLAILSASCTRREGKPLASHSPHPILHLTMAALMAGVAALAFHRMESERHYPHITAANHSRAWGAMERAAHEARSPLCSLTPIGTPLAYYEALAREQQGKPALETFAQALHDSPWHKQSLNDMGRLLYTSTHNTDSAETILRQAIMVSPSFPYARFNLAQLYLQEGRFEEARQVLLEYDLDAKQKRIDETVWQYLAGDQALYYQHRLVPAERQMKEALLRQTEQKQTTSTRAIPGRSN